jgi:galactokinase
MMSAGEVRTRASGRLCLLGEHADYLGLEVISFPLDLHLTVAGKPLKSGPWRVDLSDLGSIRSVDPSRPIVHEGPNDYLAAGFDRVLARGAVLPTPYHVTVTSTIPIGKGVSSSSAFCVAWTDFLNRVATPSQQWTPAQLAEEAYGLEVLSFHQSGGMQDHYTIAYGRLIHLDCRGPVGVTPLDAPLNGFVLGDSGAKKDTQGVLSRIRGTVERSLDKLGWHRDQLRSMTLEDLSRDGGKLDANEAQVMEATALNRDQARHAAKLLNASLSSESNQRELGRLMSEHHEHLKNRLRTSTAAIDRGLAVARTAGAFGGKVLGSGAGGCFLVYAPGREPDVIRALSESGFAARAVNYPA